MPARVLRNVKEAASHVYSHGRRHVLYSTAVQRRYWWGSVSIRGILRNLVFTATNVVLLICWPRHVDENDNTTLARHAGLLALVNLALAAIVVHGPEATTWHAVVFSQTTLQTMHHEAVFASTVAVSHPHRAGSSLASATGLVDLEYFLGIVAAFAWGLLLLLTVLPLRRVAYELFLQSHHLLVLTMLALTWAHIPVRVPYVSVTLAVTTALASLFIWQTVSVMFQLRLCHGHLPIAALSSLTQDLIRVDLVLRHPVAIRPGQFVDLCVPQVSTFAILQRHPFVVFTATTTASTTKMRLIISPRRGWTKKLHRFVAERPASHLNDLPVWISAPRGRPPTVDGIGNVVLIAHGWGLFAQVPYLQHLLETADRHQGMSYRIHVVWELEHIGMGSIAQDLFNEALEKDKNREMLRISVVYRHGRIHPHQHHLGHHHRVEFMSDRPAWKDVTKDIRESSRWPNVEMGWESDGDSAISDVSKERQHLRTMVLVSSTMEVRDQLMRLAARDFDRHTSLVELDFQPPS